MGIKYFYNFCISEFETVDFDADILTEVRRRYFESGERIRDRITLDSEGDCILYDYAIEKDKPLKWTVKTAAGETLQDVNPADNGRYYLCFYRGGSLAKRLLFSRLHTLLRAEYTDGSGAVCASVEPRKVQGGLCLLYKNRSLQDPLVLSSAPEIFDPRVAQRVAEEFSDTTAVAATNEGVIRYLSDQQEKVFKELVQATEDSLANETEESFVTDGTPLYDKIKATDFNVKRNLSSALDITMAASFGAAEEEDSPEPAEVIEPVEPDEPEVFIESAETVPGEEPAEELEQTDEPVLKPDKEIMADGVTYRYYGELDEYGNRSGFGRTVTDLGITAYEGSYENDQRSGKGAYFYKDGTLCYSGDWSENARHGVGVGVSSRDGSMHIGKWRNNKPEGNGVRLSAEGDIRFVCKELSDGRTVLMNYQSDDTVLISQYDKDGAKIAEKLVSLTDFE